MAQKAHDVLIRGLYRTASAGISDGELLRLSCAGEQSAFRAIVERHAPRLMRLCRCVLNDDHEAEDAVQETFRRLWKHARPVAAKGEDATAWLVTTAYRRALQLRETLARRRARESPTPVPPEALTAPDPAAGLAHKELEAIIHESLAEIPAAYREPFVLRVLQDLDYAVISCQLGIDPHTARRRVARAKEKLRQALEKRGVALGVGVLITCLSVKAAKAAAPLSQGLIDAVAKASAASASRRGLARLTLILGLLLILGTGSDVCLRWFQTPATDPGAPPAAASSEETPPPGAGGAGLAAAAIRDVRQKKLEDEIVPRLIADLEKIFGTASLNQAKVTDDEAIVVLNWKVSALEASQTVWLKYGLKTDEFLVWRIGTDRKMHYVDPTQPVYTELWRDGPKIILGKREVADMAVALKSLKD
jgi:RNA polymerase sigma factor (sigma-70 family)